MLRDALRSLGLRRKPVAPMMQARAEAAFAPLAPDNTLAIIGDVHGMVRAFERMLNRIEAEAPGAQIVCVGDLIDRGEHSADVLRLAYEARDKVMVLTGNHEQMMLKFLEDPEHEAVRWMRNGGLQTLASFGIAPPGAAASAPELAAIRDRLRVAIGPGMEAWLGALPFHYLNGNIAVTHAGADPWLPVARQPDRNLVWGHADFGRRRRTDGYWVAHGHVIVEQAKVVDGVISVDTGAFAGNPLSCAVIGANSAHVLTELP